MYARAAKAYKQVDLESSTKVQILDKLYLRFVRDCDDAKAAISGGNVAAKAAAINHGNQIIMELIAALDHALAPDLCGNLAALYDYVLDRLAQSNIHNDAALLDQASAVVMQLREAFVEANHANR
jgi:flagellar protein FliS